MKIFCQFVVVGVLALLFKVNAADEVPGNSVAVVGAGISGLAAAYTLQKLGYDVTVFEGNDRVGGKVESVYLGVSGAPTWGYIEKMDPEMEAKAQALCGDAPPTDLGAVLGTNSNLRALADELNVPWARTTPPGRFVVTVDNETKKMSVPEYAAYVEQFPEANKGMDSATATQNFLKVIAEFPEIKSARLDGNNPELAMNTVEFGEKYGISLLLETMRPPSTGFGYGYLEEVPAGIMLKMLYKLFLAGLEDELVHGFPCGFQSLLQAMADTVKVHLNSKVTSVRRTSTQIVVQAEGHPELQFKHLVISTTPNLILEFLDVIEEERDLFSEQLDFKRYITTIADAMIDGAPDMQFYADQGFKERINHVCLVGNVAHADNMTGNHFYQIVDQDIDLEEAFEVLQDDLGFYWQESVSSAAIQKDWVNYFPTTTTEQFSSGYYDRVEDLQGAKHTYYVGSYLSFELVDICERHSKDLILRKFGNYTELEDGASGSYFRSRVISMALAAATWIAIR